MAPHSSTLAWKIPWTEEPGGLQSMGSQRVRHDWATSLSISLSCIGEGNGTPLQCSCLENPMDGGAWWAAVYGVAQSQTQLTWLSSSSICHSRILNQRAIPARSTSGIAQRLLTKPTNLLSSLPFRGPHTSWAFEYSQSWEAKWINEGRIIGKSKLSNPSARNGFKIHSNSQT